MAAADAHEKAGARAISAKGARHELPPFVDVVIRISGSLEAIGVEVDTGGNITRSPEGLFSRDYTVLGIDGQRFSPSFKPKVCPLPQCQQQQQQQQLHLAGTRLC